MVKKTESLEDGLYKAGWILGLLGGAGLFLYLKAARRFPVFSCVLYSLLGIYCPGCGGTRALEALLQGHFLASFRYHPLVLYTAVLYGGFMATQTWERLGLPWVRGWKFHPWYLYGAVGLLVINFLIKNIMLLGFHVAM